MNLNYNKMTKTLGPQAGRLVLSLYGRNRSLFRLSEAQDILGGTRNAVRKLLFDLVEQGVVTRLKSGLFQIVPFELGFEREYLGNPYLVAQELAAPRGKKQKKKNYFISHGSAFELHQMLTQPQLVVYITMSRLVRHRTILGTEFKFVRCKSSAFFGITEMWVDKNEKVQVSDLERTLLDGLKLPRYCGGFTEVAKGFWMKRETLDTAKLVQYALKLNVGAVIRRLGFLMELYNIGGEQEMKKLQTKLTTTYHLLDPELPAEGECNGRWKLRLNVTREEILGAVRT